VAAAITNSRNIPLLAFRKALVFEFVTLLGFPLWRPYPEPRRPPRQLAHVPALQLDHEFQNRLRTCVGASGCCPQEALRYNGGCATRADTGCALSAGPNSASTCQG